MLLLSESQLEPAVREARLLHPSGGGFFAVGRKLPLEPGQSERGWIEKVYAASSLDKIALSTRGSPDTYISQASFMERRRLTCYAKTVNAAFLDLDMYKLGMDSGDTTVSAVLQAAERAGLPKPSYVVNSGRGLYMKWVFREAISAALLPQWRALQQVLYHLFREFNSDKQCLDVTRVLRLSQTVHSENGKAVQVVYDSGLLHSFAELCSIASKIELPRSLESVRGQSRSLKRTQGVLAEEPTDFGLLANYSASREPIMMRANSPQSLHWNRFLDLRSLAVLRGGIQRGSREMMLFWMTNFLAQAGIIEPRNLWYEIEQLLAGFPSAQDFDPIGDGQLTSLVRRIQAQHAGELVMFKGSAYSPMYTPTNDTLLNILQISPDEERGLRTIISGQEKTRRADALVPGRAERRAERQHCQAAAAAMRDLGLPVAQIARDLDKPTKTVYRWLAPDPRAGHTIVETRGHRARVDPPPPGTAGSPPVTPNVPTAPARAGPRAFTEAELRRRTRIHPGKSHLRQECRWTAQRLQQWLEQRRARQAQLQGSIEHSRRWQDVIETACRAQSALATQVLLSNLRQKSAAKGSQASISISSPGSVSCNSQTGPPSASI